MFAKLGVGPRAGELFRCEAAGLSAISEMAGVLTPAVVDCLTIPHGALLVLKAVDVIERTETGWEEAGRSLARIHSVKGRRFGSTRIATGAISGRTTDRSTVGPPFPGTLGRTEGCVQSG